mgnify:CR=1 FL=1
MSRSIDSGNTWDQTSIRVSPIEVISATFPHTSAGDPGRIAIAYLGSENASALGQPDIDGNPWNGNAHYATTNVSHHLYVTYSLNALDENPIFHTQRLTTDPVQVGSICLNSGDCRSNEGGSNRNLLDFNDLHIDLEGYGRAPLLAIAIELFDDLELVKALLEKGADPLSVEARHQENKAVLELALQRKRERIHLDSDTFYYSERFFQIIQALLEKIDCQKTFSSKGNPFNKAGFNQVFDTQDIDGVVYHTLQ